MDISMDLGTPRHVLPTLFLNDGVTDLEVTDMLYALKECEGHRVPFDPSAKYMKFRRIIVDWMSEVGDEFSLSTTTIHTAVYYLDAHLNKVEVPRTNLQLVAMCCILLASKMQEREDNIPAIAELNDCSNNTYTLEQMRDMESNVLRVLEWDLKTVIPSDYVPLYLRLGAHPDDRYSEDREVDDRVTKYLGKYTDFFLDMSVQEYEFQFYSPSVLCATAVACARKAVKVTPLWSPRLELISGLSAADIAPCMEHVWRSYTENFPQPDPAAKTAATKASPTDVRDMDM